MKKLLSILFIVCMVFSVVSVQADSIRDTTLGAPIMNVDDTAILLRYPALLQKFGNSIFAVFDNTLDYAKYGVAYKASDMLGLMLIYENVQTPTMVSFKTNGAIYSSNNIVPVSTLYYGLKMADFYAGFSAKTYFYDGGLIKTVSYTNTDAYSWIGFSGFKTTFNPSASLEIAGLNIYGSVNTTLDFTKHYGIVNTPTNVKKELANYYMKNALVPNWSISALVAKNINDSTLLGVEVKAGMTNLGYSYQAVTNGTGNMWVTNSYQGSSLFASLGIGSRIKATETVTIFFDMLTSLHQATPIHKKDAAKTYLLTTTWLVPSFTLGSEFELLKNLKLRISAKPTYSITYAGKPANAEGKYNITSTVGTFDVASDVGLGYKIGSFYINWEMDGAFLNTLLKDPQQFITFDGSAVNTPITTGTSKVQVNYVF